MILVDSSVLIDYLRKQDTAAVTKLQKAMALAIPFGITELIYQELLQGAATAKDYRKLKDYLDTQQFYALRRGRESYADAALIYFRCRQAGYSITGTIDCLIAQTCLENQLALLHNDRDFTWIKKVVPELMIY